MFNVHFDWNAPKYAHASYCWLGFSQLNFPLCCMHGTVRCPFAGKLHVAGVCICVCEHRLHERSYHVNCTRSRPIPEVKLRRVQPVVRCVSTCEAWILFVLFMLLTPPYCHFLLSSINYIPYTLSLFNLVFYHSTSTKYTKNCCTV